MVRVLARVLLGLGLLAGLGQLRSTSVVAQTPLPPSVTFPVADLGNCRNQAECRAYCDVLSHVAACVAFAEEHHLLSAEELAAAKQLAAAGGLGGCHSRESCERTCRAAERLVECIDFADRHGLIPPKEIAEARKVLAALRSGATLPGNCTRKEECLAYCQVPSHLEECLNFAEKAQLISPAELREARKFVPYVVRGETPGKCQTKAACLQYCEEPAHVVECIQFAERAGLLTPEERVEVQKVLPFLVRGETPGRCTSKAACERYCAVPAHLEECITFAAKAGFISPAELAEVRRVLPFLVRGETPGKCLSKAACMAYCASPVHMEECLAFAEKAGFVSPPEAFLLKKLGGWRGGPGGCQSNEECETFCSIPAHQEECLAFAKKYGLTSPEHVPPAEVPTATTEFVSEPTPPTAEEVPEVLPSPEPLLRPSPAPDEVTPPPVEPLPESTNLEPIRRGSCPGLTERRCAVT